jgi:hypothetical protein
MFICICKWCLACWRWWYLLIFDGGISDQSGGETQTRPSAFHRLVDPEEVLLSPYRLLASRVLITPANGPNTELAKNLILAGVNVTIYDDAIVNEDDF